MFLTEVLLTFQELTQEELQEKTALIRKLQCQLRNEEMSLVLLKKIRQTQVVQQQAAAAAALAAQRAKAAEAAKLAAAQQAQAAAKAAKVTAGANMMPSLANLTALPGSGSSRSGGKGYGGSKAGGGKANFQMPDLSQLTPVVSLVVISI